MAAVAPDRRSLALQHLRTPQAVNQELEAVQLVLQLGADVNATNQNGDTALHIAASKGSNAIVQLLVAKGAKLNLKNKLGQTPLSLTELLVSESARSRLKSTVDLLQKLGASH